MSTFLATKDDLTDFHRINQQLEEARITWQQYTELPQIAANLAEKGNKKLSDSCKWLYAHWYRTLPKGFNKSALPVPVL